MDDNTHFADKRKFFDEGKTLSYEFRIEQLKLLKSAVQNKEKRIEEALKQDLGKSRTESWVTEISFVLSEIDFTIKHLEEWMSPEKKSTPIAIAPSKSRVYFNPKGVVLIISPWNYPIQLCLVPLIGAIAAGNCAVVKPSEDASSAAAIVEEIIMEIYSKEYISVIQGLGHVVVPEAIQSNTFNHIFFTGSIAVGKKIAAMAAETLTSTTLELGGKSPVIVDQSANIKIAAKRIVWGKLLNAGQTCVSPDYLLIEESIKGDFVEAYIATVKSMFGENQKESPDFPRIVNKRRFDTLVSYLTEGNILFGGETDESELYIAPTLIDGVSMQMSIMNDEIFGPILPIITFSNPNQVLEIIRENRYPLACYYFGNSSEMKNTVLDKLAFGGGCINDTVIHLGNPNIPFGGVQTSGTGAYHGWDSFLCFSNQKSIVHAKTWIDPSLRYPPYSESKLNWLKKIL